MLTTLAIICETICAVSNTGGGRAWLGRACLGRVASLP